MEEQKANKNSATARRPGRACDRCGGKPPLEEMTVYIATGLCAVCTHMNKKMIESGLA
jgi:hypothetical protein